MFKQQDNNKVQIKTSQNVLWVNWTSKRALINILYLKMAVATVICSQKSILC